MEVYTTENEQVDALRRFLRENGKALAVGVVLGIGALVGWRFWQSHQDNSAMEISSAYQQASETLTAGKGTTAVEAFAAGNKNNYGALASMELAAHYAELKDFAKAEQQLTQALSQSNNADLQTLINLRLARVQLAQKKADDALKTLDAIKTESWAAMIADVRGDVLVSKGDNQGARSAYEKGIESQPPQGLQALLRMKLNNLSS